MRGKNLSASQLNASAGIPGGYDYTPGLGAVLNSGNGQTLTVIFTPTDTNYAAVTKTVLINVDITQNFYTSHDQNLYFNFTAATLNVQDVKILAVNNNQAVNNQATGIGSLGGSLTVYIAPENGYFSYTPPPHTVGDDSFTVTISTLAFNSSVYHEYNLAGVFHVTQTTPTIIWSNPADIIYGTPLGSTQLNATAPVGIPGTFTYSPDIGAMLNPGDYQTLSVVFTPNDTTDYRTVTQTVTINVHPILALTSVTVNGGAPQYIDQNGLAVSLAGQNSVVEQLLVEFNQAVTLDSGAFRICNDAAGVTVLGGYNPNTLAVTANTPIPVLATGNATTGYSQYIVTFSGPGTNAIPGGTGNVIKDGLYILHIDGSKVHANGQAAATNNVVFWALYGSSVNTDNVISPNIGDGNSEVFVSLTDFSAFRNAFGSESDIPTGPPIYSVALDSDLSGFVDLTDFGIFQPNFGADWAF